MPQAISYIRFSSLQQGSGSSTERQQAMVSKWLAANPDYTYSSLSVADLGISGYSGKHLESGLGAILAAIEKKLIKSGDVILIEAIDRLGRLPITGMQNLINSIIANDVSIITLEDGITYSQDTINNDHSLSFILLGKIQQANNYSRNLSRRISAAYESKRRKAKEGQSIKLIVPFWLDKNHKLKPTESKLMLDAITLYLSGKGYMSISNHLNKYINERSLKRWFQHKALIGTWENGNDPIPNVFEPLIDETTYYKLQHLMKQRERIPSPENFYHLQSLIKCPHCNGSFHFRRKLYKHSAIIYANCSTFIRKGKDVCSNSTTWSYGVLSYLYQIHLLSIAPALYLTSKDAETEEKTIAIAARISEVTTQIERLSLVLSEVEDLPELISQLKQRKSERDALFAEQQAIRDNSSSNKKITITFDPYKSNFNNEDAIAYLKGLDADPFKKRLLLQERKVYLYVDDRTIKAGIHTYHLIKRSTRFNCYILKKTYPTELLGQPYCSFIAVRGDEVIATAPTITDLLANKKLSKT